MDSDTVGAEPVNLGNPNELTVGDLVNRIVAMTGTTAQVHYQPLPVDDPRRRKPDITRATTMLGWAPLVPLEAGLSRTCAWFAEELRQTDRLPLLSVAAE
jgi:nucleoside-diphosphate-sugar epimerase